MDFSCILGFPHECQYDLWERHSLVFYGEDSIEFIAKFIYFVKRQNLVHEDMIMKMFSFSIIEHTRNCYYGLPPKGISSSHGFLMIFKEDWIRDEDKDLIGSPIDAFLWVEICKENKLNLKEKLQEHEMNTSNVSLVELKAHEEALLYLIDFAWHKCDILRLKDQKKILSKICEEIGFEEEHEETLEDDVQGEKPPQDAHEDSPLGDPMQEKNMLEGDINVIATTRKAPCSIGFYKTSPTNLSLFYLLWRLIVEASNQRFLRRFF